MILGNLSSAAVVIGALKVNIDAWCCDGFINNFITNKICKIQNNKPLNKLTVLLCFGEDSSVLP